MTIEEELKTRKIKQCYVYIHHWCTFHIFSIYAHRISVVKSNIRDHCWLLVSFFVFNSPSIVALVIFQLKLIRFCRKWSRKSNWFFFKFSRSRVFTCGQNQSFSSLVNTNNDIASTIWVCVCVHMFTIATVEYWHNDWHDERILILLGSNDVYIIITLLQMNLVGVRCAIQF